MDGDLHTSVHIYKADALATEVSLVAEVDKPFEASKDDPDSPSSPH